MKYVIAGGSGFLGSALSRALVAKGHEVAILSRSSQPASEGVRYVAWNAEPAGPDEPWVREIDGAGVVVNLAGAGIADKRWTAARKEELRRSRILSTRALVSAIRAAKQRTGILLSGSAVGYYGAEPESPEASDESSPPGSDFFATLAVDWEAEAHAASALGCRVLIVRSGVVLHKDEGALKKMMPPFKFFVGGPIGSGRQVFSWIHRDDWVALVMWLLEHPDASGVFNVTAPGPVTNEEFSRALGRALHRPSWLRVPGFALRILVGELADIALLKGQRVIPARATQLGFTFQYPDIRSALEAALH